MNKHFTQRPYKKIKAQQDYPFFASSLLFSSLLFLILVALMSLISQRVLDNTKQIESLINETKEIRVEQQEVKEEIELLKPKTIQEKIIEMSIEYGVDTQTALDIAECESQFGKYQTNWEGSSAKGIYMFMPKTFNAYCDGNIDVEEDQIICFMKLYQKHPEWWKCK